MKIPLWKTWFDHGGGRRKRSRVCATPSSDQTADLSQLLICSPLASGGHSRVYYGKYKDQDVAVKAVNVKVKQAAPEGSGMCEVSLHSGLNHPNIVRFIATFTQKQVCYIITEYLSEGSLRAYMKKQKKGLVLEKLVTFSLDIARGMEYLHSRGIIHRDLKPENILIEGGASLKMKVADFGISCLMGEDGNCAKDDAEVGTYRWMAPEMIKGKGYGRKVDVYSFGLLLSEMVSGRIPFKGLSPIQAACAVNNKNLRPGLPDECPPPLRALIERCWDRKPEKRPEFCQVVKVLEGFESSIARDGNPYLLRGIP